MFKQGAQELAGKLPWQTKIESTKMKRQDKIDRLVAVQFSKTELTAMTNDLLDATYEASRPLMQARQAELDKVRKQEQRRDMQRKAEIMNIQAHDRWSRNWSIPPICTLPGAQEIIRMRTEIKKQESEYQRCKRIFRVTGDHDFADKANAAMEELVFLRLDLKEKVVQS